MDKIDKVEYNISGVKLSTLNKMVLSLNKVAKENGNLEKDVDISFEFIIGSLFPDSWKQIQKTISDFYTKGYIDGSNKINK